jgi:hypothetical protein
MKTYVYLRRLAEILLDWKKLQKRVMQKSKHTFYVNTLFRKSYHVRDNYKKYGRAKQAKEMIGNINKIRCHIRIYAPAYSLRSDAWKPINYTVNYVSCHVLFLPCTFYLSLKQTNCVQWGWDTATVVLYLQHVSAQLGRCQESSIKQVEVPKVYKCDHVQRVYVWIWDTNMKSMIKNKGLL